jgi:hypothetical protein
MSAAKRKGTKFESDVRDFLNGVFKEEGVPRKAYRPAQEGFRDTGDLHGLSPFILQAKNWKDLTSALREGVDGAQVQAGHAGEEFGAAVIKRPRKPVSEAYVVLPLRVFARLLVRLWRAEK